MKVYRMYNDHGFYCDNCGQWINSDHWKYRIEIGEMITHLCPDCFMTLHTIIYTSLF